MALTKATTKAIYLRKLLYELGFSQHVSTTIYSDSQSAITLSKNQKYHSRSKYEDIQYYFTREKILAKEIKLKYVPTTHMRENIFTKSLSKQKHFQSLSQLGQ
uniref:Reverse transcriptase Ty1/copia-type domain-containing protein n=1 Tax=Physcomitrium patens TaxID=3218 RepID=A0A2K1JBL2_PHYPA|nr:hypothetical protein PHYPA_019175 [Physcomitrium patens]